MFYWGAKVQFQAKPKVLNVTRAGVLYEFHSDDVTDKQQNPFLLQDQVAGSEGGTLSGPGFTAVVDSRDHLFFPNRGGKYTFEYMLYTHSLGSDFNYNIATLDLRQYRSFSPDHVLALQAYAQWAGGDVPFYRLPALGGQNRMRGYFYGRYVDQCYLTGQAEYRQYFWKRLGFVVFGAFGNVANAFKDLSVKETNISAGAGLRLIFNEAEKVNLRVDLGFGSESNGVYFGLEEAF
jgi:outer membrane protein assembly factor BamA